MIPSDLFRTSLPLPLLPPAPPPRSSSNPCSISGSVAFPSLSPSPPVRARGNRCTCRRRSGGGVSGASWDSNAESVRAGRFEFWDGRGGGGEGDEEEEPRRKKKRRWWSDEVDEDLDPFGDEFDEDPAEQQWDMIWIFKVFKSYGYLLPAIIASMLLATGPKAFLMALALPLGQSAITLAIDKLWGKAREGPRTKTRTRKKPFAESAKDYKRQWPKENSYSYKEKEKQGYQSWVSANVGVADRENGSAGSDLGGWDELDRPGGKMNGAIGRQSSSANNSLKSEPAKKGKLSKRVRQRDVPLFLRLLIAVFPFLGSWTRIL